MTAAVSGCSSQESTDLHCMGSGARVAGESPLLSSSLVLVSGNSHLVRNDFALMCILNGNDYLPKLPGFSFARFSAAYEATRRRSARL